MELRVNDYVRTNKGFIYKLSYYNKEEERWICVQEDDWYPIYESTIVKSSPNIIDLIEVGDYVNGLKVDEIDEKGIYNYNSYDGWRINIASCNEEIKSIVTKEAFESMEYMIGE
jgi:hypothetical protein